MKVIRNKFPERDLLVLHPKKRGLQSRSHEILKIFIQVSISITKMLVCLMPISVDDYKTYTDQV